MRRPVFRLNSPRHEVLPVTEDAAIPAAPVRQFIAETADVLNACLGILDQLEMSHAAAHLSAAIESLAGPTPLPSREHEELLDQRG